jgi:hypothetical protein
MNWEYALGSHQLRRYPVFRRQPGRAARTHLADHPHTAMMRVWVSLHADARFAIERNDHHAVFAALMPYRLPARIARTALATTRDYSVRIGRGPGASPELYTAGRGSGSLIVARPLALFLDDGASDVSELFHLGGAGDYHEWNNTGVLERFAVARSPAHVPSRYEPDARGETWRVYGVSGLLIAVADTGETAAMYLREVEAPFHGGADTTGTDDARPDTAATDTAATDTAAAAATAASRLLARLEALASASALDEGSVRLPDGRHVEFDLTAAADRWVITAVNGDATARDLTKWPRMAGSVSTP